MSDPLDKQALKEQLINMELGDLAAAAGSLIELEAAFSLGSSTGRMRDSLPDLGDIVNLVGKCEVFIEELATRISKEDITANKTRILTTLYYTLLSLKREAAAFVKDIDLIEVITYHDLESNMLQQQEYVAHIVDIVTREE